jgi:hypothetical protein
MNASPRARRAPRGLSAKLTGDVRSAMPVFRATNYICFERANIVPARASPSGGKREKPVGLQSITAPG